MGGKAWGQSPDLCLNVGLYPFTLWVPFSLSVSVFCLSVPNSSWDLCSIVRADVSAIGSGNQHLCELAGMELGLQETEHEVRV